MEKMTLKPSQHHRMLVIAATIVVVAVAAAVDGVVVDVDVDVNVEVVVAVVVVGFVAAAIFAMVLLLLSVRLSLTNAQTTVLSEIQLRGEITRDLDKKSIMITLADLVVAVAVVQTTDFAVAVAGCWLLLL